MWEQAGVVVLESGWILNLWDFVMFECLNVWTFEWMWEQAGSCLKVVGCESLGIL
jgi:hypothetical protein